MDVYLDLRSEGTRISRWPQSGPIDELAAPSGWFSCWDISTWYQFHQAFAHRHVPTEPPVLVLGQGSHHEHALQLYREAPEINPIVRRSYYIVTAQPPNSYHVIVRTEVWLHWLASKSWSPASAVDVWNHTTCSSNSQSGESSALLFWNSVV